MKRYLPPTLILVLGLSLALWAAAPSSYNRIYAIFFTSDTGQPEAVTPTSALPVVPKGATSVDVSSWSVGPTPASWTMTASATDFALWNLGTTTVWLSLNSGGATVSQGIPLTASSTISRNACYGIVVWAVSSAAQNLTRAEGRR